MRSAVNLSIIGGGMISQIAHLPFYLRNPHCNLLSVAEVRPSLVRHLRDVLGVPVVETDYRAILHNPEVTAVVIIAPRPATGPLAFEFLQAGKDVIVEKPMAHTVEQAQCLVNAAKAGNRRLGVAFMKRYDPGVQVARQEFFRLMQTGECGPLLLTRFYDYARDYACPPPPHKRPEESREVRFPVWPTSPDWVDNARRDEYAWFMNAASHDINLMQYFFPEGLRLCHAQSPVAGGLLATFESKDCPVAFELAKSASGAWLQGAEFVFEKAVLRMQLPSPMASDAASRVSIQGKISDSFCRELPVEPAWSFQCQADAFVEDLLRDRPFLTSGADALADLVMIEEIWRALLRVKGEI